MATLRVMVSPVSGRIRCTVPPLHRNPELAAELERSVSALPFVTQVRANPRTSTMLVLFDARCPPADWEALLRDQLLHAQGELCKRATPSRERTHFTVLARLRSEHVVEAGGAVVHAAPLRLPGGFTAALAAELRKATAYPSDHTAPAQLSSEQELPWHTLETAQLFSRGIAQSEAGLTGQVAESRLAEGKNTLAPPPRRSELRILLTQFSSIPVVMLAGSALVSILTGGLSDAAAIMAVLGINTAIGYITESGAERSLASLSQPTQRKVPVLRDGIAVRIDTSDVVLGDVLVLESGVFIAADARVLSAQDLTLDESSLTGESMPVAKSEGVLDDVNLPLADRTNMVYRGTLVTGGRGRAVVIATGQHTQLGQIQTLANALEQRATPMQAQLDLLGRKLALGASLACAATLGVGLLRGRSFAAMFRTATSLGIAAVPEGLPTVAVTTLAFGLARMRGEHVIVRQLSAVEGLGSIQVLCLDKTGTLTVNRMTVVSGEAGLDMFRVDGSQLLSAGGGVVPADSADIRQLLLLSVLCSEVKIEQDGDLYMLRGSPTESALVQLALDMGMDAKAMRKAHPRVDMQRRAYARSYMTTLHETKQGVLLAVKGRPSDVLALCSTYLKDGRRWPLGKQERAQIEADNQCMAGRALRVLGFAFDERATAPDDVPRDIVWLGLIGMEDPTRVGARDVIAQFQRAGVQTVMITGDQSATAQAVAQEIGLANGSGKLEIVDSTKLDRIDASVLEALTQRVDVYARVSPAHKLQIVRALQASGLTVAMTGDGINDGPALKAADIGIAMGAAGSSAAREVADVVLEQDDLRTLVSAIEQGRTIYDDIRKAVHFILATNLSEILYTFMLVLRSDDEPLSPFQLLWINLLTDVLPELALALQPSEVNVLETPPRKPGQPMFTRTDAWRIGLEGGVITSSALSAYLWTSRRAGPGPRARTVGFTSLTLAQLLHALSARSETHTIFDRAPLTRNGYLSASLVSTIALQLLGSFVPSVRKLLGTVPMSRGDWALSAAASVVPLLINESVKGALRSANTESAINQRHRALRPRARPQRLSPAART